MGEFEHWPKGVMCTLMPTDSEEGGDSKYMWDKENEFEVESAEEHFDSMVEKGCLAFKVKKNGKADKQIKKFDPNLERIIFTAPMAGG